MKKVEVKVVWEKEWQIERKLVLKEGKVYVPKCYDLKSLGLDKRTTLVLENTKELDRVPSTK